MHRRHVLTLLVGVVAGCSEQAPDPTATSTPPPTTAGEPTATAEATPTTSPTTTTTTTATPTAGGVAAAVLALNDVYAAMRPALESVEVSGLDYGLLARRLGDAEVALAGVTPTDAAEEARVRSLSDTRWIFDRLVRTFVRLREAYGIHTQLLAAYRAREHTGETGSLSAEFGRLATEAGNSSGTAVSRYDSVDAFDPALDVSYERFETEIFRVSDTVGALTPLGQGLDAAIRARESYEQGVTQYENGSYRDGQDTFGSALARFTDALDDFEEADEQGVAGPLGPHLDRYLCETRAARLACVEYRAACREQMNGDPDAAERRREQAERRFGQCEATTG
ncbi:hypothetical protein [Salinigranum salinum]|uniref:hypothetical protein n=1 Tax=Salinigranum salinum TaxID=1364937 RepID=UPI0012604B75|nr:hypothetical protein [Salinigranum salinum]